MKAFSNFHPAVLLIYFAAVFAVSMFVFNPVYLIISFSGSFLLLCALKGFYSSFKSFIKLLPFLIIVAALNPLFSHNGATPLFFINDNAVTTEAVIYGCIMALMLLCVIFWFKSFNMIFDSEKILFLFGKISPKISLVFSMALHFIPNFTRYFNEVLAVQKSSECKSKLKLYTGCFSSVITHSIESSVDTSDSMSARGYGSEKPVSFSRFNFKTGDLVLLVISAILTGLTFSAIITKSAEFTVYPQIILPAPDLLAILSYTAFAALCFIPGIYEITEDLKWKYSILKI